MNERIRELYEQAGLVGTNGHFEYDFFDPEKFAELLVRECQTVVDWAISVDSTIDRVPVLIKEHFGVEE
jgi:8-oxo-dGTP pyrophosphatase MutT (NUDIX family)